MVDWRQPGRALVVGLGIEGIALARFLAGEGWAVTVADGKPAAALGERLAQLDGVPVAWALGGLDPTLAETADALFVSQSVPLSLPLIEAAGRRGLPVESALTVAYDRFPGRIAAVTGSSGKTTTTSLVDAIFTTAGRDHLLAGNIGRWPLAELAGADADDWAVFEVSHTQLQLPTRSPQIACVTNVTPNHLDQFRWDEYVDLKRNHVRYQGPDDFAVLNHDEPVGSSFAADTAATVWRFTLGDTLPADGACLRDEVVTLCRGGAATPVLPVGDIPLRGRHNVENVLAATAVAAAAGIAPAAIAGAVRAFQAIPHRLELIATVGGVGWYNDSIATTPERTLAGLRSFREPIVLLLGGRDKHLPLDDLAAACAERCRAVVAFGEAGDLFAEGVAGAGVPVERVGPLEEAVVAAARLAQAGDVVLLSPAGTSFDAYPNFEARGQAFRQLVKAQANQA